MSDSDLASLFPWWAAVDDGEPDASRARALEWLGGSYAQVLGHVRTMDGTGQEMLSALAAHIRGAEVPAWEDPVQMEAWLRGLTEGWFAASLAQRGPR